jgi:outer membrane protein insertion porin family
MHDLIFARWHRFGWLIWWAILLCTLGSEALAQEADLPAPAVVDDAEAARGLPIVDIQVLGNRRITSQDVLTYLQEKVGDPFSPEDLADDVRELWNSGFFDDIEVDLERSGSGVNLRFLVRERPNIKAVEFEGNDEIDDDDLNEAIEVKTNTILSRPAIGRTIQKIRDMYAEKGYFLAEADSEVVPEKNNEVTVKFKITEHNAVSVRRITFIGNEGISDADLKAAMITGNPGFFGFGSGGPFRQDAFERDVAIISALYYDKGYLTVSVSTPRIMLTPDRNGIEISVTINEGPRFKIRQLRVFERGADGKEVEPIGGRRALRNMVRAESGQFFNRAELAEDLQAVQTLYRDHGYANVLANPETRLLADTQEVDVIVPIIRGPIVYFDRIEVRGNTKTRDKVIRREMEIIEGHKFSETALERSRRRITALGYFERVDISTSANPEREDRISAIVEVVERPTGTFQVGAGFSSIENFIATAQVQQANLFGNGQSLSLNAQISRIRQLVNIQFFEPYFLDSRWRLSLDLFDQLRVYTDFSQQNRGGALTFGYPLIEPELTASLTYTLEDNDVSTERSSTLLGTDTRVSIFTRLPLANLFNDGLTSSIRPALTYDTRDNRLFPTSGIYLRGSTELAVAALASDSEFWRNRLTGRFYYPVGGGAVNKLNTETGLITSPTEEGVPIFARFFLGGILDVRGYRFRTVGPRVPLPQSTDPNSAPIGNGARIGGNLQYYQNLEFEFPLFEQVGIRGVVFTDAGNAWNLEGVYCSVGQSIPYKKVNPCFNFPNDLLNLRTSYGFGVRWFSPLGPLRFEWGFPINPLPFEETSRFEFTIGNFF